MSQVTIVRPTTNMDVKKIPRDIVLKLKRVALEKDISYQEACLEAFKGYLARNKALYEKEIVIYMIKKRAEMCPASQPQFQFPFEYLSTIPYGKEII